MLKIIFLLLMSGGIPVAIAMAGSSLIYILWTGNLPPFVVIHRMVSGIDSFPLLAVPFFILAGNLMNNAGITNRIYNYALALVGWLKGGLGHVNVVGSVVFTGATIGVTKNNHIQVDFFYRFMPARMARVMAIVVDVVRTAFFAAAVVLTILMMMKLGNSRMTMVDLPMNYVYGVCALGFALMTLRSVMVARRHWQRGYRELERPMTELTDN